MILVTWNQREDARECLASLDRTSWKDKRIVLVDNASEDGTCEDIRRRHPETVILEQKRNKGFAAANNIGIRYALDEKIPYIFLLNTDTIVAKDIFDHLVEALERDTALGLAGPKMYFYDDPTRIWFAGGMTDPDTGHSVHLRFGQQDMDPEEKESMPCNFIAGAGMFIRSEVFHRIGLLDESFFHTAEDNDFCIRAHRAGFKMAFVPQAKLWHKVMSTTGGTEKSNSVYTYYEYRNKCLLMKKHSRDFGWLKKINKTLYLIIRQEGLLLLREKNPAAALALLLGVLDFFRGRTGPRHEKC